LAAANPSPGRQPVGGRPGGLPAGDGPGGGWRRPAGKPAGRKPLAGGPVWALVVFRRGGAAVPIFVSSVQGSNMEAPSQFCFLRTKASDDLNGARVGPQIGVQMDPALYAELCPMGIEMESMVAGFWPPRRLQPGSARAGRGRLEPAGWGQEPAGDQPCRSRPGRVGRPIGRSQVSPKIV
jgi:hypothetical protein